MIFDIWRDGRVLLARAGRRRELMALSDGASKERDLSWLTIPIRRIFQRTAKRFSSMKKELVAVCSTGMRRNSHTPFTFAARMDRRRFDWAKVAAAALSPDQKWVIIATPNSPAQLRLLPTGAGETQQLTNDSINHQWARWLPDGKRFVFSGNEPDHGVRLSVQGISGGKPTAISPEGVDAQGFAVSPDGQSVVGIGSDQKGYIYAIAGGEPKGVSGWDVGDVPVSWSQDGQSIIFREQARFPPRSTNWNWLPARKPCGSRSSQSIPQAFRQSGPS